MLNHSFLGSNTPLGFKGFFDDFQKEYNTFILKGGPGTGKSTLMKKVGSEAEKLGFTAQYFHCSSDPDSLDGVLVKQKNWLVLDGTSPTPSMRRFPW